jgi:hypothetical protein
MDKLFKSKSTTLGQVQEGVIVSNQFRLVFFDFPFILKGHEAPHAALQPIHPITPCFQQERHGLGFGPERSRSLERADFGIHVQCGCGARGIRLPA